MQEYWGQGIATESARACLDLGFGHLDLNRIIGLVLPENAASIRVLEKLGFQFEKEIWEGDLLARMYGLGRADRYERDKSIQV